MGALSGAQLKSLYGRQRSRRVGAQESRHCSVQAARLRPNAILERAREGTIEEDAGAYLRDGLKIAATTGVPVEASWPYAKDRRARPDDGAWATGLDHRFAAHHRITSLDELRAELAEGHPVVFGFDVPESFESAETARTGIMHPLALGERIAGGHAVVAVGYDDVRGQVLIRNSWGARWGLAGYFWMPFACWCLVMDAWAARAT
jgi:C1A family cysteine protease